MDLKCGDNLVFCRYNYRYFQLTSKSYSQIKLNEKHFEWLIYMNMYLFARGVVLLRFQNKTKPR